MRSPMHRLSVRAVQNQIEPGHYPDGAGLYLQVKAAARTKRISRSWLFRYHHNQRPTWMGLGSVRDIHLADARMRAAECRRLLALGNDPIAERDDDRVKVLADKQHAMTFDQCAQAYITAHRDGWRNAKHATQWENTLRLHASPVIGKLPVEQVELRHVLLILEPIRRERTETASRVRGRIDGIADFMQKLARQEGTGAQALAFLLLTAARSGEVRGATRGEIDAEARVWSIPGSRMKAGRDHRVPLFDAAWKLLPHPLPKDATALLFPAPGGGQLSDMTLTAVMRRMEVKAVPHGFRSIFREWCAESTDFPREVAEMALAHAIGDKVEAAYRRDDLFDKRRQLMSQWAGHCGKSGG